MSEKESKVLAFLKDAAIDGTASSSIRTIGAAVGMKPGTVQQTLARLAKQGVIERVPSEGRTAVWKIAA